MNKKFRLTTLSAMIALSSVSAAALIGCNADSSNKNSQNSVESSSKEKGEDS